MRAGIPLVAWILVAPLVVALSPPTQPLSPAASTGANVGEIDLSWSPPASPGATPVAGYRIYRSLSATGLVHLVDVGNILAFTDNTVPDGAPRYYRSSAVNGDGEGPLSDVVSAQAKSAPTAPTAFAPATGPGRYNVSLAWAAPQYDGLATVTSYNVYRASTWTGPFSLLASTTNLSHVDPVGGDNVSFAYSVTAVNAHGEGPATPIRNGTSASTPGAPIDVRATPRFPFSGILIEWDIANDGGSRILEWHIDRSVNGGAFVPYLETTGGFKREVDENCPLGSNCTYKVKAMNLVGFGPMSASSNGAQGNTLPVVGCLFC